MGLIEFIQGLLPQDRYENGQPVSGGWYPRNDPNEYPETYIPVQKALATIPKGNFTERQLMDMGKLLSMSMLQEHAGAVKANNLNDNIFQFQDETLNMIEGLKAISKKLGLTDYNPHNFNDAAKMELALALHRMNTPSEWTDKTKERLIATHPEGENWTIKNPFGRQEVWANFLNTPAGASGGDPGFVKSQYRY